MNGKPGIVVEAGGVLRLPPGTLRHLRAPIGTTFFPLAAGDRVLIMFREDEAAPDVAGMVGDCTMVGRVGAFSIADLFSTLNMGQKTGVLMFEGEGATKRVYFEHGEIVFAVSDDPEHRLGHILVKRGLVKQSDIDGILAEKDAHARLGARLIQKGMLRAKDLYEAVRYQVEEIVYSIFPMSEGIFTFFEGEFLDEDLSQFRLNTQNLLMEGYRRLDEWGVMRERIPHEGVILLRKDGGEPSKFDTPHMEKIYGLVDGKRSVKDLIAASGLGEFDVHRAIYDLLRRGAIDSVDPKLAKDAGGGLRGMVEAYNKLYLVVVQALSRTAGEDAFSPEQFDEFVAGLDERARRILRGVRFDPETGYAKSIRALLDNLEKAGAGAQGKVGRIAGLGDLFKRQQLQAVLDEVLNYLLFTLKNALPPAQADTFIQKVRAAHKRLRDR